MQQHPILTPNLTTSTIPACITVIRLKSGALGVFAALEDANATPYPRIVRTLPSLTNGMIDSIPSEAQSEAL